MDTDLSSLVKTLANVVTALSANLSAISSVTSGKQSQFNNQSTSAEFVFQSLSTCIPNFVYDPENNVTFDVWYQRYQDCILMDGSSLNDATQVRLLLSKLDSVSYARFADHVLPKKPAELNLDQTVKILQDMFSEKKSLFSRRYACMKARKNPSEDLVQYAGTINQLCERFELSTADTDDFKCLVFVAGLDGPQDVEIRTRILQRLETKRPGEKITLNDLLTECHHFLSLKNDSQLIEKQSRIPVPMYKTAKNNHLRPKAKESSKPMPKYPCRYCGEIHFERNCTSRKYRFSKYKKISHENGCYNLYNSQKEMASTKQVEAYQKNRAYANVQVLEKEINMQLDTDADVSVLGARTWKTLGSPVLQQMDISMNNANGSNRDSSGFFETQLDDTTLLVRENIYI
uniref:Peptidase A2 domain-containing protein n=1 Tax=Heterorhabditis bacteriophora TaxID=37862 RepID=A0A1I7XHT6_HETBA